MKYEREIITWIIIPVAIVLGLLVLVWFFERMNIHVPGSREMWIGLIGAVLGGMFTMIGVLVNIHKQQTENVENKRLERMPILTFKVIEPDSIPLYPAEDILNGDILFDEIVSCIDKELSTSAFACIEEKIVKAFEISVLDNNPVFDFSVKEVLIDGEKMVEGVAFNPSLRRIIPGEKYILVFDIDDYPSKNLFCLFRFSYKDIYGNKYYQELPFEYVEVHFEGIKSQHIDIRDIKSPMYTKKEVEPLEESAKKYCDYKLFCMVKN